MVKYPGTAPIRAVFSTSRIFALFLFAFRCLAANHASDHQDDSIVLKDGFVFVYAIINGHGPFRMLVDTGTTTTLLAPSALKVKGVDRSSLAVGKSLSVIGYPNKGFDEVYAQRITASGAVAIAS